jgi:two-component system, LytTR family, sensor kinase
MTQGLCVVGQGGSTVLDRLRHDPRLAALAPALVLWGFGYTLVDIFAFLLGRTTLGANLVSNIPLFVLGVTYTVLLDRLRERLVGFALPLRFLLLTTAVFAATALHTLTDLYWYRWLALNFLPSWRDWAIAINLQRLFTVGLLYLWTFCLAMTLLWATRVGQTAERNAQRATRFEAASHRAEAAALRLQLNPHFLFNTLNSISSLVTLDRKEEAENMIGQLSDFLRASLVTDPTADVSLGDEIGTIEAYLDIEAARFGSRMNVEFSIPSELTDVKVPNFILQPLVENAIKHGVAATRSPTLLCVTAETHFNQLILSVINRTEGPAGTAAPTGRQSTGIGIANIRQRLLITYGKRASLETERLPDGYRAMIKLPFPARN